MKHITLTTLILALLLFGCNQTESKKILLTNENSANKTNDKAQRQKNLVDNEKLEEDKVASIKNVIDLFKEADIDKISNIIYFPLERQYPIPSIKDKEEFTQRFSQVFDKNIIDRIANSKIEQWAEVGWRGIMLDQGEVWMANSDGVITAVNYQSEFENKLRKDLIEKGKEKIHISLRTFENPIYLIKSEKYLIRIDELTNLKYRYASWKIGEKESSKPDIILDNGELELDGSGGNHIITFVDGISTYKIYRNSMGFEGTPDISLEIEKNGQLILIENGTLIIE